MDFSADKKEYSNYDNSMVEHPNFAGTIYYVSDFGHKQFIHYVKAQETIKKNKKTYAIAYVNGAGKLRKAFIPANQVDDLTFFTNVEEGILFQPKFVIGVGVIALILGISFGMLIGGLIW